MRHSFSVRIGSTGFRIGSVWSEPIWALQRLYRDYPEPNDNIPDFTVRLEPEKPWRRWLRPSVAIKGDYTLSEAAPLALRHGLLAAEMGMNLQMALGQRRHLLLHAATLERDGKALILTGESGAGKSTLAALLGERGWRLMGDEFALMDPDTGLLHAFPRAISLKNNAVSLFSDADANRWGPVLEGTPKGTIRHLRPRDDAIALMSVAAKPALLLFPRFGFAEAVREIGPAEVFMRLTQASTNYVSLGEPGFAALDRVVRLPARAIDYADAVGAITLVERIWQDIVR
ncbi:MAG: HprK-related kinase A [Sphingomonadaceae bacterium]